MHDFDLMDPIKGFQQLPGSSLDHILRITEKEFLNDCGGKRTTNRYIHSVSLKRHGEQ